MIKRLFVAVAMGWFAANAATAGDFLLTSPTMTAGATLPADQVFNGFGCQGKNESPSLRWTPGPQGTRSYAVTLYDPDAPGESGWWHWIVYNIPAGVTELAAGAGAAGGTALPAGAQQGRNNFGTRAYGGACPPRGSKPHRYIFTVHALKTEQLDLPADVSLAGLIGAMNANTLDKASLTLHYHR